MSTHYIEEAERLADTRDDHVARPRGRRRARRTTSCSEHAGEHAIEVYGPPARLREVESVARGGRLAHPPHRHVDLGARLAD